MDTPLLDRDTCCHGHDAKFKRKHSVIPNSKFMGVVSRGYLKHKLMTRELIGSLVARWEGLFEAK